MSDTIQTFSFAGKDYKVTFYGELTEDAIDVFCQLATDMEGEDMIIKFNANHEVIEIEYI